MRKAVIPVEDLITLTKAVKIADKYLGGGGEGEAPRQPSKKELKRMAGERYLRGESISADDFNQAYLV